MKSMTLVAATALAGALYVVSPAAKADFIFGSLTPTPACVPGGNVNSVCAPDETFTSGGQTLVAHGFLDGPLTTSGTANLTLKPQPLNTFNESGLGVQSNATSPPAPPCTDPDCEISPPRSVSATASTAIITDAIIGS